MNKKVLIIVSIFVLVPIAYWLLSPLWRNIILNEELPTIASTDVNDAMPVNQTMIIRRANMIARTHDVEGTAVIIKSGDETFLRFENLKTINGPDLRIYLSSSLNADDVVDLGPIRATEGNVNYTIPAGTDIGRYKNVMIWCRAFGVLFSYAQF